MKFKYPTILSKIVAQSHFSFPLQLCFSDKTYSWSNSSKSRERREADWINMYKQCTIKFKWTNYFVQNCSSISFFLSLSSLLFKQNNFHDQKPCMITKQGSWAYLFVLSMKCYMLYIHENKTVYIFFLKIIISCQRSQQKKKIKIVLSFSDLI